MVQVRVAQSFIKQAGMRSGPIWTYLKGKRLAVFIDRTLGLVQIKCFNRNKFAFRFFTTLWKNEQKPFEISVSLVLAVSFTTKLLLQVCFILVGNTLLIYFQKTSGFDIFSPKRFLWYLLFALLITLLTLLKVLYCVQSFWFFDLLALRNSPSWSFICFLISSVIQGQGFPLIVFFVNREWVSGHFRRISLIYCQHIFESR